MKTERFIVSLFMINILLAVILVYTLKNETVLSAFDDIFHSKKVSAGNMTFTPNTLKQYGFKNDPENVKIQEMNRIFAETPLKHGDLDRIENIPPYDRSMLITKMFSSMGDGVCLDGMTLSQKINEAKKKHGCSKDYAEIFSVLATYTGLKTRMVHNNLSYGVEVFDGRKWFFIDPYFAITITNENGKPLSYPQVAWRMVHNGWMKFNFFGGVNHCMNGKSITEHPYYSDREAYSSIYSLMGDNIISIVNKEVTTPRSPRFVFMSAPYRDVKPYWMHVSLNTDITAQLKRTLAAGIVLWVLLLIATDFIMPIYFVWSKIKGKKRSSR